MLTVTSKCDLHIIFNCTKFPQKAHELEISKKKSREAWENKSIKGDTGT